VVVPKFILHINININIRYYYVKGEEEEGNIFRRFKIFID